MFKHILTALMVAAFGISQASAITLAKPGTIEGEIPENSINELVVDGHIDASDLLYISEKLSDLLTLNLSDAIIDACDGVMIGTVTHHPANTLPANIFAGTKLQTVILPASQGLVIKPGAFAGSSISSINIPVTVASIGDGAFTGCTNLAEATVSTNKLGKGVFSNCTNLESVVFTVATDIPENTFYGCTNLAKVSAPAGILSVGDRAFSQCANLKEFPFTSSIASIGREAFMQSGLNEVDLTASSKLKSVGEWAFAMMPALTSLKLGNAPALGNAVAFACPNLAVFENSANVSDIPDFALTKSATLDTLDIVGIEYIGRYALSGLSGIRAIQLPTTLEKINDYAMQNMTGLENIYTELTTVPELGENVWDGVDQKNVTLEVPDYDSEQLFRLADQWQNFKIINSDTASSNDAIDNIVDELRARFDGDDLIVQTGGVEIENLMLYNPAGALLIAVQPMEDTIVVNTAGFGTRIFIVHASLADGRVAALKLAK